MKKYFYLLLSLFMFGEMQAQRVDLDKFNFTAVYRSFPQEPLPEEYRTYNVRVEAAPSLLAGYNLDNAIDITGLRKVPGTGHVTILAMLDDIVIDKTETRERIEVKKDKQGNEIKVPHYATEFTYSFSARASIYDYRGNTILSNISLYDRNARRSYKTSEFGTADEAVNFYSNKAAEIRQNLSRKLVNESLGRLNSLLNSQYGYNVQRINDILWILNNRRHPEYSGHQKAWNAFKNAIVMMDADQPLDKVREQMKPAIAYFESIKKKYAGNSKEDRKLRYASYYNLSKIYFYLDEPEKAIREADALAMNDFDERDGTYLRASAEQLANLLARNNASSRHFPINIESYEPPVR